MAAHRVYQTATRIFNWALNRGDIEASPFAAMKPPVKKVTRDRALKDHEIKALWPVLTEMNYPFGPLQQLLLLLGQRRSEVAEMRWPEVDLDKREWTIPASRSKSKREHIVPLAGAAVDILESLPRFTEGDFVFTTTAGRRPVAGFSKIKLRIDRMLVDRDIAIEGWRVHDLRRTCRTGMARLGVPEIVSERVLNHQAQGLTKIYNLHEYLVEKRDALARWAQEVANIVEPPPDNVIDLATAGEAQ
jgi:integrase